MRSNVMRTAAPRCQELIPKGRTQQKLQPGASAPIPKAGAGARAPHISPAMREDALFIPALSPGWSSVWKSLKQTKPSCSQMLGGFQVHLVFPGKAAHTCLCSPLGWISPSSRLPFKTFPCAMQSAALPFQNHLSK